MVPILLCSRAKDKGFEGSHRRTTLLKPRTLPALSQIITMHAKAPPIPALPCAHTGQTRSFIQDNEWEDAPHGAHTRNLRGTCAMPIQVARKVVDACSHSRGASLTHRPGMDGKDIGATGLHIKRSARREV
ncbi:hypothetical protein B0H19DRAFT_1097206 [Mycena capillaripes]|nr:hypothetical protein B0H19DRAFT_1097206 [Mycena capillaripes]